MNEFELEALKSPLSNVSRVLYCVYLRPQISEGKQQATINNKRILDLINSKKTVISLGRQISSLLKELKGVGLIKLEDNTDFSKSLHNKKVILPLTELPLSLEDPSMHNQYKSMKLDWRPIDKVFDDLCSLVGLIEKTFSAEELGEFIAYWLGRVDTQCTEYQWTQKLVIHLKQRRQRFPLSEQRAQHKTAAGHQYVEPSAGIVFDDNVKLLIEQYKNDI
ncbi:DnaT-like ssDNA-binding domain-containing protein [Glaciecola petra]|uniref:DnaT-like ssDNA-binding domain-containing protein n=1 Tax=Glaciecola petra TaxID=3075602 RepID=A0ABU2ZQE8_9ALTE|nr:DnaT-like ssDNA-binding domain-containing protein [Aestuariibacter sp. P117]MDT0594837.1 DnaT-like ssDNA-binding domain-containing protein [Aestuariibacter sp. P117]